MHTFKTKLIEPAAHGRYAFNDMMLHFLERVEYRFARNSEDIENIYRLRYRSYLRGGMASPNPAGVIRDRWDDLPNSHRFAMYFDGRLVSTVRFHHLTRDQADSPSMSAYPEVLAQRVAEGETFMDGTRFATDAQNAPSTTALPFLTLRLAMVGCSYFNRTSLLIPVKMEHSAFYIRNFNVIQRTEGKLFPGVIIPIALFEIPNVERLRLLDRFPFFRSTPTEQRLLFGPKLDENVLSVVPSAKFVREAA